MFRKADREQLERIWLHLGSIPITPTTVIVPRETDLRPLLNELGQAVGRVEAKPTALESSLMGHNAAMHNRFDHTHKLLSELEERLVTLKQEIISESWDEGYEAGLNATTCAKCDKTIKPAARTAGKPKRRSK